MVFPANNMIFFYSLAQYAPGGGGTFMGMPMSYILLLAISGAASWFVGHMLKKRFAEFSQIPVGPSGAEVARQMLRDAGIRDVEIISTPGQLTDHYNPADKTVNLSEAVYAERNVAAAAVAAHECGHAIQHAKAYAPLQMRSALVPMVSIASRFTQILLIAGIVLMSLSGNTFVMWLAVATMAAATLFSVVTLPVEFDASRRALAWIKDSGIGQQMEYDRAKTALFWAAMTYVVAALAAIGQLLYYVMMLLNRRD